MSDVVDFSIHREQADPDVVALCRKLLDDAESGRMRAVVMVAELSGGEYATSYDGCWDNRLSLLGSIERLKHKVNRMMDTDPRVIIQDY